MITKEDFRNAMSELATGVTVITTTDENDEPHSMTANSFTSVCLEPPVVLVCVAHGTHTYGYVERNRRFGVNFLQQAQQELGAYFAKRPEDRQGGVDYAYGKAVQGSAGPGKLHGLYGLSGHWLPRLRRPYRLPGGSEGNTAKRCRRAPTVFPKPVVRPS